MIIKKKKTKKKMKLGYNHGYGKGMNHNKLLSYFGICLLLVSFGVAFYSIEYSEIPLADNAEYPNEEVIIGTPSGFGIPEGEF